MDIIKLPLNMTKDYKEGWRVGTHNMLTMVLTVFEEHPEMTKEEIKNYIKENL